MEENEKNGKQETDKVRFSMRSAFVIVTIVFSFTLAFLVVWQVVVSKSGEVHPVEISIITMADSIDASGIMASNEAQLRALTKELMVQNQEITLKYECLVKAQETQQDFFRLVSTIAAFVLALLGFLGYRTITDIEKKAASIAEAKAEETAKTNLDRTVNSQLTGIVGDSTAAKLLTTQIRNSINKDVIDPLESRVSALEGKYTNDADADDRKSEADTDPAFGTKTGNIDKMIPLDAPDGEGYNETPVEEKKEGENA